MGKVKAMWQADHERLGIASDGVFSDYVNDEVWQMRSEVMSKFSGGVVRDEYDLWVTHDGEGDN
jgi:hypothetical protein